MRQNAKRKPFVRTKTAGTVLDVRSMPRTLS